MADRGKDDGESASTVTSSLPSTRGPASHGIGSGTVVAQRYDIVRLIAHGGMGAVYEAFDLSLQQKVALKTIRSERASDIRAIERFKREALLARRVTHRNVCRVFDVGYHDEEMFLTMELLAGETLAERLRRGGRMAPVEALPIVQQVVAALSAAHQAGVVHRDFKSSNVMLTPERVVVTDFGLAHDMTVEEHERSRDGFVGSPAYVAPEQVDGRQVSFASDIYALGVVMFQMLTGELPFLGATPMATAVMRLNQAAPSPRALLPTIPVAWERVILRCLERDPAERFGAVEDVLAALAARPVAPPKGRRRRRTLALVACAIGVGLSAVGAVGWRALRVRATATASVAGRQTLAVTDLVDRTGRAEDAWHATAFAELLAVQLDGGEALRVMPRAAVAGRDRTQLMREGASLVLTGSYRQSGDTLVFDVQIVDLRSGRTLTDVEETGPPTALFDVAARAATRLRRALGLAALSPAEATRTRSALPSKPDAARHYTEGLTALRRFRPAAAQRAFDAALSIEPDQPMVHAALAAAWHDLESDERERAAARRAFELSANLPREERLSIEAAYREALKDWSGAAQIRLTLATFFPDNLDYGLKLADAERRAGRGDDALATLARLRRLPPPDGDDPRIDVAEANTRMKKDSQAAVAAAKRAIDGARRRGAVGVEADARVVECAVESAAAHIAPAEAACGQAMRLFAGEGNDAGVARAMVGLAQLNIGARRADEAAKYERDALALYRKIGSRTGEVRVHSMMAMAYKRSGDLASAERLWRQAIDDYRTIGEPQLMIKSMDDLASILTERGRLEEALPLYRQVIETAHAQGLSGIEANAMSNFSMTLMRRGELAEARRFADAAVALWTKLGQKNDVVYGLDSVEQIALRQGRLDDAQKADEEALTVRESLGWIGGPSRQNLAELAMVQGNLTRARELGRKAVDEFRSKGQRVGELYALDVLTRILVRSGRMDEAAGTVARENELLQQTGASAEVVVGSLALVRAGKGDVAGALSQLRAAIAESDRKGDVDAALDQREVLAEILVQHGPRDEARSAVATLRREATAHGYTQAVRDAAALERRLK